MGIGGCVRYMYMVSAADGDVAKFRIIAGYL